MKKNKIIVCICARNFNVLLLSLLKSLAKNTNINFDVLIVFNKFKKITFFEMKLIQKILRNIHFSVNYEGKKGISNVRNKVLEILRKNNYDYIFFLDDDCVVNHNFLKNHLNFLNKEKCDIVGGPQLYLSNKKLFRVFERNLSNSNNISWVSTNNVIFKRKILLKNIEFSNRVSKYGFGEDQLFFLKCSSLGFKIRWNDNPVYESVNKNMNLRWFLDRNYRYGLTGALIEKELCGKYGFLINLFKSFYYLVKSNFYIILMPLNPKLNFYFLLSNFLRSLGRIKGQLDLLNDK